ncbi:MAG: hypothetical protein FWC62_01860 [Firmicutes bacterium]|nr:hypothetical protein [Bacillota bacterium]
MRDAEDCKIKRDAEGGVPHKGFFMLEVFYAETSGADEAHANYPGRSKKPGSAFAVSLLAHAVREIRGIPLPEIAADERGKPHFPQLADLHFSYAHTAGLVLCAVSDAEVGADAERIRSVSERLAKAPFPTGAARSAGALSFFEIWTLMESAIKRNGEGNLLRFSPEALEGLHYRHYVLPSCAACVCSRDRTPPEAPVRVAIHTICT